MENLKYVVFGAGGTGGSIAGVMAEAGKDVTLIARGKALETIRQKGLTLKRPDGEHVVPVRALSEADYTDRADIIFVCVKGYSLEETYSFIRRTADAGTIVIPILNIYGTGEKMSADLPGIQVLNGCIYIAAYIEEPGVIRITNDIFRIVYGRVDGRRDEETLFQVERDLRDAGITPVYSGNIRRDTLQKYAMVSPMAAVGVYLDVNAGQMQTPGEARDLYITCVKEIVQLAAAMGIPFEEDVVAVNVKILDDMVPDATASMYKDWKKGGKTEMDGLIFEMVRMGHRYGVPVPGYERIAAKFGF